jgi:dehydrogenase/reductase SDR family protein 1
VPGPLAGKVALVTGGSRGMGKGAALGLAEVGATVYLTARNARELEATAREVTRSGAGKGIAMQCDHRADSDVRAVFRRIEAEQGRLDVLVNNVFPGLPPHDVFWELPVSQWDDMAAVGLRSHFVASALSASLMISRGSGLIAFMSSPAAARSFTVPYHAVKAAIDRMAADMAAELRPHGVTALSLRPWVDAAPQFTGRAIAALASDPNLLSKTGRALPVPELAHEYGFTDVDGSLPDW